MCGIYAYGGNQPIAIEVVRKGLETMDYRGYDSWGIAALDTNQLGTWWLVKRVGRITDYKDWLKTGMNLAIGHTRWATHGRVCSKNAHPIIGCQLKIAVVHNGIVENFQAIRQRQLAAGHKYQSETDTESLVHGLETWLKQQRSWWRKLITWGEEYRGRNAWAALDGRRGLIVAGVNGSPLILGRDSRGGHHLASDELALHRCQNRWTIPDGSILKITHQGVEVRGGVTGHKIEPEYRRVTSKILVYHKQKQTLMENEIEQQPEIWEQLIARRLEMKEIETELVAAKKVLMLGCGSAYYAAKLVKMSLPWPDKIQVLRAGELRPETIGEPESTLVVAWSQSGETMDTIEAVERAKKVGVRVWAVVNNRWSTLARLADGVWELGVGPELAVASTKAMTAKVMLGLMWRDDLEGFQKLDGGMDGLVWSVIETWKNSQTRVVQTAKWLASQPYVMIVGGGKGFVCAEEIALKWKEVGYLPAEAIMASELKHGPLALIEPGRGAVLIEVEGDSKIKTVAAEIKARGGKVIGLVTETSPIYDWQIRLPANKAAILTALTLGQKISLELARLRGINPDRPRNLAKAVTVR